MNQYDFLSGIFYAVGLGTLLGVTLSMLKDWWIDTGR